MKIYVKYYRTVGERRKEDMEIVKLVLYTRIYWMLVNLFVGLSTKKSKFRPIFIIFENCGLTKKANTTFSIAK